MKPTLTLDPTDTVALGTTGWTLYFEGGLPVIQHTNGSTYRITADKAVKVTTVTGSPMPEIPYDVLYRYKHVLAQCTTTTR